MWKTRVCDILGIQYPIIQSPMNFPVTPELVAAVSNAGGLGNVSSSMLLDQQIENPVEAAEHTRTMIRKVRQLTDKPFGMGMGITGSQARMKRLWSEDGPGASSVEVMLQVAVEEKVPVVYVSQGGPEILTGILHEAGIKVLHIGTRVRHALKAQEAGVDVFVCAGYEAGGHSPGHGETTLFTLLPQVVDALEIPVLAGSGVGDGRGFVAALALGAEGVSMGTRFLATQESRIHPRAKQAIVEADDAGTVAWGKALGSGLGRSLKNKFTQKYLEMELGGGSGSELMHFVEETYEDPTGRGLNRRASSYFNADLEWGEMYLGAISGLIREIKGAGEVVRDMVAEAEKATEKVLSRLKGDPDPLSLSRLP